MKLTKPEGSDYIAPQTGLTQAVITAIYDMGSRPNKFKEGKLKREVMIVFTLPKQLHENEMLTISVWTTASIHEKSNLYGLITDLGITIDTEFDLNDLLGINCMANLTERTKDNGDTRINVSSVAPIIEGMEQFELPTSKFSLEEGEFVQAEFEALSDGLQNVIKETLEFKALSGPYADIDTRK